MKSFSKCAVASVLSSQFCVDPCTARGTVLRRKPCRQVVEYLNKIDIIDNLIDEVRSTAKKERKMIAKEKCYGIAVSFSALLCVRQPPSSTTARLVKKGPPCGNKEVLLL
ncbi:hypothetical protein Y032_0732g1918 [Ancylostoma ceylanicum]|uniref:Uncharacterized protein n=1 Tax=Ancylostoma ceylanicum TaxID=53326 RepID=A0A016WF10_9BILA|nr:hypothetical protein Y032_0732g1918 [Ancylostoma ceylanicum]